MGSLISALITTIAPALIHGAEKLFAAKDKAGPQKKDAVVAGIQAVLKVMMDNKIPIPGTDQQISVLPTPDQLSGVVEAEVQRWKLAPPVDPSEKTYVIQGKIIGELTMAA